jgi:hypothetical protein
LAVWCTVGLTATKESSDTTNAMKLFNLIPAKRSVLATAVVLAAGVLALMPRLLTAQPSPDAPPTGIVTNLIPVKLGSSIPLAVQSAGVVWRGYTCHLVRLGSIKFELDNNNSLKADIQAGVTMFDDVDYDISGAVFDATGQMLGSARAQCKVERMWVGEVRVSAQTIRLDFGVSLDYTRAAFFMVSISNRKVLTPDEWKK